MFWVVGGLQRYVNVYLLPLTLSGWWKAISLMTAGWSFPYVPAAPNHSPNKLLIT